jgi:hypothetical protein
MGEYLRDVRKSVVNFFAPLVQELFLSSMNSAPAHEILPGVWLGNRTAAHDSTFIKQNNITAIFNCTKDIPFKLNLVPHMYRIPLDDNLEPAEIRNLELWSWEAAYKLAKELADGNHILVHCAAGMQRSAATVAIYIVMRYRCTTDEAIAFIKSKRGVAFYGGANFYQSIRNFELGLRRSIAEKNSYQDYPRIPLPSDAITNT